mmetsp:Transcript_17251/g.44258  ORF Transcript_17251/g.44258 Transcript_17251/m.44258 type:complete len:281 (+) Transcript_17251:1254-2096(+)
MACARLQQRRACCLLRGGGVWRRQHTVHRGVHLQGGDVDQAHGVVGLRHEVAGGVGGAGDGHEGAAEAGQVAALAAGQLPDHEHRLQAAGEEVVAVGAEADGANGCRVPVHGAHRSFGLAVGTVQHRRLQVVPHRDAAADVPGSHGAAIGRQSAAREALGVVQREGFHLCLVRLPHKQRVLVNGGHERAVCGGRQPAGFGHAHVGLQRLARLEVQAIHPAGRALPPVAGHKGDIPLGGHHQGDHWSADIYSFEDLTIGEVPQLHSPVEGSAVNLRGANRV